MMIGRPYVKPSSAMARISAALGFDFSVFSVTEMESFLLAHPADKTSRKAHDILILQKIGLGFFISSVPNRVYSLALLFCQLSSSSRLRSDRKSTRLNYSH